ncbi:hypothetical protein [Tenacibaculum sp. nBUS_03]
MYSSDVFCPLELQYVGSPPPPDPALEISIRYSKASLANLAA